ncbi:unnamed protein product [Closterium sp. NIES-53]
MADAQTAISSPTLPYLPFGPSPPSHRLFGLPECGKTHIVGAAAACGIRHLDLIDPALLHPGRLDRLVLCDFPREEDWLAILRALSRTLPLGADVDLAELARCTEGLSSADLQALLADAQLAAVHAVLDEGEKGGGGEGEGGGEGKSEKVERGKEGGSGVETRNGDGGDEKAEVEEGAGREAEVAAEAGRQGSGTGGAADEAAGTEEHKKQQRGKAGAGRKGRMGRKGKKAEGVEAGRLVLGRVHLEQAVGSARPSVPAAERQRLSDIYNEMMGARKWSSAAAMAERKGKRATLA